MSAKMRYIGDAGVRDRLRCQDFGKNADKSPRDRALNKTLYITIVEIFWEQQ